ncbi:hybrid sensor histidine kinase/response regulator [Noviherbaspirillum malthae]|uniref:hybrid sensor histidine kinase/response regulator n=1 Tax=Noviherbaspirillum malthae TaxID=1260987 RepID=UPI0018907594|nr:ATP-binding protein [Noviherbaspirillum malthae]
MLVGLLPLVMLSASLLIESGQRQRSDLIDAVQNTMDALGTAIDAEFEVSISALDTLGASMHLQDDDLLGFYSEAIGLLKRRPGWANIVLSDPAGQQIINANLPYGTSLPRRVDSASSQRTASLAKPTVGNLIMSAVLKTQVFAIQVPIKQGDKVKYVLAAAARPALLQNLISQQHFPQSSVIAILDPESRIVARSHNLDSNLGKSASPSLVEVLKAGKPSGWTTTTTLEGVPVYTVFTRSAKTGWTAVIGIPRHVIDGPVHWSYAILAGAIVLSVLLGLGAAFVIGRSIISPVKQLERAAVSMGQGVKPAPPETDISEIREVGLALAMVHVEREALLGKERIARSEERQARLAAESANRAKDEFLAMLGHELRNPLAPIYNAAQLLKLPDLDRDRIQRLSAIIERQTDHLTHLVDDLLDVARVISKRIVLQKEVVNINDIVPEAIEQVQQLINERHHRLVVALSRDPLWISADKTRLVQVIVNLLHNAAKYTPEGGVIELTTRGAGGMNEILVKDNGVGISRELLPRIFDLFVQSERTLERAQGGLGLGLSLVKGVIELHEGEVRAASPGPGLGSDFTVRLKQLELPSETARQRIPSHEAQAPAMNQSITIVDDNADAAETLAMYLRETGLFTVTRHLNPHVALEAAEAALSDIYILDIGMPEMDGFELARRLRSLPGSRNTVIIALSGYGLQDDREKALEAGFDYHFTKPVNFAELRTALREVHRRNAEHRHTIS